MEFGGWISAQPDDIFELMSLGVRGNMYYREDHACFEHCEVDNFSTLLRLKQYFPKMLLGAWTAVDAKGFQLPPEEQVAWQYDAARS